LLNILYKRTNHFKNLVENRIKKFNGNIQEKLDVAVFGSSHAAYDFDFSETGVKGFNFAIIPQSINYTMKMLEIYHKKIKRGGDVILVLPTMIFCFDDYSSDWDNTNYYYFMQSSYINNYRKYKYFTRVMFPLLSKPQYVRYIIKDVKLDASLTDGNLNCDAEITENAAQQRVSGWCRQFELKNLKDEKAAAKFENEFTKVVDRINQFISFCNENQYNLTLVIPPYSKQLKSMISDEFNEYFLYKNVERLKGKFTLLDYQKGDDFDEYKYYVNSDFMNRAGAVKFTKNVVERIKNEG
jgi:hypothetical protein